MIKHKLLTFILTLCLISPTSFAFAADSLEESNVEGSSQEEIVLVEEQPEIQNNQIEENQPQEEATPTEEAPVEKIDSEQSNSENIDVEKSNSSEMRATAEESSSPAYYGWHSENDNGEQAWPKSLRLTPTLTEEDFITEQTTIVLQGYDENGNVIENTEETIPIEKIDRYFEGDFSHPGWNIFIENLIYNDTYVETIYHGTYTFVVVYYLDQDTNEQIHTYNYELIGWSYLNSEKSPRQDATAKTWDVSEWDALDIEGYDYETTIGKLAGAFSDLTEQHNIYVYYKTHEEEEEIVPSEPVEPIEPEVQPDKPKPEPESKPETETPPSVPTNQPRFTTQITHTADTTAVIEEKPVENEENEEEIVETIENTETPKAQSQGAWALINLIAAILTILTGLLNLLRKNNNEEKRHGRIWKTLGIILGIVAIIIFILTENIWLPMVLIDKWTLLMIVLLIVAIINIFIVREKCKEDEEESKEKNNN